ncbi:MAG: AAA family ATPase [Desulfamplus sp.]|nr:AAA family ATPase [Desulfamplus sp.]
MTVIVCPKCSKQHQVNISNVPTGKRIVARCKACGHSFPIIVNHLSQSAASAPLESLNSLAPQPSSIEEALKSSAQKVIEPPQSQPIITQPDELLDKKTAFTRRISVSLSKGGVGKTTTSVNLSAGLALAGFKVLLIDTDTQGQSAYNLGKKPSAGLTELLTGELSAQEATIEARKNLWLLAGGRSLAGVKRIIDKKTIGQEWTLSEALTGVDEQYDFVIIDTSPGWDSLTINVMFYVTEVLVPVALEAMPYQGLTEFIKSLSSIHKYRKEVALKYIVPTFMDTRVKHPQEIFKKLKQLYSEYICKPIRYNEHFSEAPSYGKTIFEYAPGCNGALDYKELIRKVAQDETLLQ